MRNLLGRFSEITRAFVRARWTGRALRRPLPEGPIETAAEFSARFSERNVLGLSLDDARRAAECELAGAAPVFPGYSFGLSTGTTGSPGVFVTSARERSQWVGTVLGKFLPLRLLAGADVALILKHNSQLYRDVGQTRRLRLHYFSASDTAWEDRLCAVAPALLIGPPSALERVALSRAFAQRPFRPQVLLAGAEPLFPQDRAMLTAAYGVPPRVIYQAKEGFLAAECEHGGIHLNQDLIQFEEIPLERDRFIPVITDWTRTSQTYRRFLLDDVLVSSTVPCTCGRGFQRVEAVEGRAQDVLLMGNARLFPLEVNALLQPHLDGRDYRVVQLDRDVLSLAVAGSPPAGAIRTLGQFGRVVTADYSPPAPGEKRRRVSRLFDPHNDWLRASFLFPWRAAPAPVRF